jgi:hypothetical protein
MHQSPRDGCDLPNAIFINFQKIYVTPRDECDLPSAICTNLQGMDVISAVLYASLAKG